MSAHTLLTTCFLPLPSTPFPPSLPFQLVARGVLCNYLVCMAVWVSQAAADLVSKATAIVLIITIFASLSFEHSVANMFIGKEGGGREGRIPERWGPVDDALFSSDFFAGLARPSSC